MLLKRMIKLIKFKSLSLKIHLIAIYEKRKIKKLGFHKLKFIGWTPYSSTRRFYKGFLNNDKCFIKVTNKSSTTLNEIYVLEKLKEFQFTFVPTTYLVDQNFQKNTLLAIPYYEHTKIEDVINNVETFDFICKSFINILHSFYEIGFVHGDLHKGNVLVCNNNLIVIDFGISTFISDKQKIDYIKHFGTYFETYENGNKTIRRYDDAFSVVCMIESLNLPSQWLNRDYFKAIKTLVGRIYFEVQVK